MEKLQKKAEDICNNIFYFDRTWDMEADVTKVKLDPVNWRHHTSDPEWNYMLNRMEYLLDVVVYSQISGKDQFKDNAINLIYNWIQENATIDRDDHRTLDTGIRLLSWSFTLSDKNNCDQKIIESITKQVDYLMSSYRLKDDLSNWGLLQTIGVLSCKRWLSKSQVEWWEDKLKLQIDLQVTNDGWHWEHSIMYHNQILLALCRLQLVDESYNLIAIIDRLATSLYLCSKPNYKQIQQNDSDDTNICGLLGFAHMLTNNKLYEFKLVDKRRVVLCEEENVIVPRLSNVSTLFPDSGLAVIRKDNLYLAVHNHPYGSSHSHMMWGHVDFFNKADILIDPGRYSYVDNEVRRSLKAIESHNCAVNTSVYKENILNSWDSESNAHAISTHLYTKDELVVITTNIGIDNQLVVRDTILIGDQLLIFDVIFKGKNDEIEANLVVDPSISISEKVLSNNYRIISNYQTMDIKEQHVSKAYNELDNHFKINFKTKESQLVYYQGLLSDDFVFELEYEDNSCVCYKLSNGSHTYLIYLCPRDILIGSKVKQICDYSIYGKVVIIDTNTNKIYKARI